MTVGPPRWLVGLVCLIAPCHPANTHPPPEQFEVGAGRAGFNELVLLVWFSQVLAFPRCQIINLPAAWGQSARVFSAYAEEN
jgi:hypothetical protein